MEFDSIVTAVQGGKFDVGVSGFTITEDRKEKVNFSDVYSTAYQAVVVKIGSEAAGYTTYDQLMGKTIGVETGTTGNYMALEIYGESSVKPFNTYGDVFQSLLQGKIDCVIVDNLVADSYVKKLSGLKVSQIELPGEIEEYGFVFNKSDTELLALTNKALAQMKADGILDKIFDYYASVDYSPDADGFFTAHPEVLESIKAIDGSGGSSGGDDSKSKSFWERISQNLFEKERYNYILTGLENTIIITLIGLVIGLVLGILAAIVRSCHDINGNMKILNAICKVYITVIRGTPTMVQLLIIYFVVFASSSMNALIIAGIAFGINSGAYVAEIVRAGINAVPKGQLEAGRSLGLPFWPSMTKVIMPQAIRNILPALCNEGITLLKETSIAGYIGIVDLTKAAMLIRSQTYDAFIPLLVVAAIYLIIVLVLQYLVGRLERRLNDAY
jgi:polar amino acid transport system substrate-binding protein